MSDTTESEVIGTLKIEIDESGVEGAHHTVDMIVEQLRYKAHEAVSKAATEVLPGDSIHIRFDIGMNEGDRDTVR